MYTEKLLKTQKEWAEKSLFLLRELLPLMSPVALHADWTKEERHTLGSLLSASARSSESVLLLSAYGQLWDAEVILRSVFEGTLKLAYLLQSVHDFKQRHEQYAHDLFRIALLKDHKKATDLLNAVSDPDAQRWRPVREILLSDAEQTDIRVRYGKSVRRALDMQWGFTGLVRTLMLSADAGFSGVAGLAHGYSIASHIQHADSAGTSMPLDRELRSADRRDSIHLAHLGRLISDVFACLHLRLAVGYRYVVRDPTPVAAAAEKMKMLQAGFGTPYKDWMDAEYGNSPDSSPPEEVSPCPTGR